MRFGSTPLHFSALKGHYDIVRYLVDNGADIHLKDKNKSTALYSAETNGHFDIVEYLKDKGADSKPNIMFKRTIFK